MRWITRILTSTSPDEIRNHADASTRWSTCAVGEFHGDLPQVVRYSKSPLTGESLSPLDGKLRRLGNMFHESVSRGHRHKALKVYRQIEARVRELVGA